MSYVYIALQELERRLWDKANKPDMVNAINAALVNIGEVTRTDTSLVVVKDQLEYALPRSTEYDIDRDIYTTTQVSNVVRVQVATSNSGDYDYETIYNWREQGYNLCFDKALEYTAGRTIKIYYNGPHPPIDEDLDEPEVHISNDVPMALLVATAAYYYYLKRYSNSNGSDRVLQELLKQSYQDKMEAESKYRINRIYRDPILN